VVKTDVLGDDLGDRPAAPADGADREGLAKQVPRRPELSRRRRQQRLGEPREAFDEGERPLAEGELRPPRGAE